MTEPTNTVGAPEGNNNSNKNNRVWADTIRRALIQSDGERIRRIAEALLTKAEDGDMAAIKEMGDRLDGKATLAIEQTTEISGTLELTKRPKLTRDEWLASLAK